MHFGILFKFYGEVSHFQRMYGNGKDMMDYVNVPTTVFTPIELLFGNV